MLLRGWYEREAWLENMYQFAHCRLIESGRHRPLYGLSDSGAALASSGVSRGVGNGWAITDCWDVHMHKSVRVMSSSILTHALVHARTWCRTR